MMKNLFGTVLILIGGILSILSLMALVLLAVIVSVAVLILCISFGLFAFGVTLIS